MPDLAFRAVTPADADLLFQWANDPVVRANSYHDQAIGREEHERWLQAKLADTRARLYLMLQGDAPAGLVRFDDAPAQAQAVIGVTVAPAFRGQGLAARMLTAATAAYLAEHPGTSILAYVKTGNLASVKAFERAGFRHLRQETVHGHPSHLLTYP